MADPELHRPHRMLRRRGAPMLLQRWAWLPAASALVLLLPVLFLHQGVEALPLSTRGRWMVDAVSGQRVKLRCVNWAAHMPAVVPEGLDKQPLDDIVARVAALGFNCVRLTWATYLFTRPRYENLTVAGSLSALGLDEAAAGLAANNPFVSALAVREAYAEVVRAIGEAGLMAVLDNHVSRPQWCCASNDGNGFFGDLFFDPEEWLRGLEAVATRFRGSPQVVGMSMRNELRGANQSEAAWRRYVTRGARTIHRANPDALIIVSGLSYDTDLSFLAARPLPSRFDDKLVLEAHWYSFGKREDWASRSPDRVCADAAREFENRAGFVTRGDDGSSWPLFVSEFGVDQRGTNRADNRFLSCFLAFAAERDLDWGMWALQGSYYWRNGQPGFAETYGVLDANWDLPRNPRFPERFRLIQGMLQDPDSQVPAYLIIYHPLSGQCLLADDTSNVVLGDCRSRSKWSYGGNGTAILSAESSLCLRTVGDGSPVVLSPSCSDDQSAWTMISSSGFRIAGMDAGGSRLCLQGSSGDSPTVETRQCPCLGDPICSENPQRQWFRFVPSNVVV
ncbi:hypothetical protein Taro_015383 [Colocasia esculenta]|uniref:Glycoside hydrolase family 5 domain-containing protein n=1 Tax=Colocasia esculenta TaxID=4460 RepID=A0A843UKP7_COLES|nr:hypothetical protein [Colocasia esculenta]